jgi:hypothetical protein
MTNNLWARCGTVGGERKMWGVPYSKHSRLGGFVGCSFHRVSVNALAKELGVSQSQLSRWVAATFAESRTAAAGASRGR